MVLVEEKERRLWFLVLVKDKGEEEVWWSQFGGGDGEGEVVAWFWWRGEDVEMWWCGLSGGEGE